MGVDVSPSCQIEGGHGIRDVSRAEKRAQFRQQPALPTQASVVTDGIPYPLVVSTLAPAFMECGQEQLRIERALDDMNLDFGRVVCRQFVWIFSHPDVGTNLRVERGGQNNGQLRHSTRD